jgi:hypothetical protein
LKIFLNGKSADLSSTFPRLLNFPKAGKLFFHFFENFLNRQIDGFHGEQSAFERWIGHSVGDAEINDKCAFRRPFNIERTALALATAPARQGDCSIPSHAELQFGRWIGRSVGRC